MAYIENGRIKWAIWNFNLSEGQAFFHKRPGNENLVIGTSLAWIFDSATKSKFESASYPRALYNAVANKWKMLNLYIINEYFQRKRKFRKLSALSSSKSDRLQKKTI